MSPTDPARKPFVAGNWKMNKDRASAVATATEVAKALSATAGSSRVDVGLFPPALFLADVVAAARPAGIVCGAQDMHWEKSGAFTGEIAAPMIASVGATAVLLGHSERRQLFGETDEGVRKKLAAALAAGLRPIVCVGETLTERDAGRTSEVVLAQIDGACEGLAASDAARFDVAYEPVWAIGTGRNATPEQAAEVHAAIRKRLEMRFGPGGRAVRILYGGSVNGKNVESLMAMDDIDGALVGGASLEAASFIDLIGKTLAAKRLD